MTFSQNNRSWNFDTNNNYKNFVWELFPTSNTSNGYHGILQQWWEYYNK